MSNSSANNLDQLRPYIVALMQQQGRLDSSHSAVSELCHEWATPYELHHTRYEGATYYDLLVVCRSCNRIEENVGLN